MTAQITVTVFKNSAGIVTNGYEKALARDVEVIGMEPVQLYPVDMIGCGPDENPTIELLKIKDNLGNFYWISETVSSFYDILKGECCAGSGGGSSSGAGFGLFTTTIPTSGNTFQDNRLIGATQIVFVLDGAVYQDDPESGGDPIFGFDSETGTITLTTPPFSEDSILTVIYGLTGSPATVFVATATAGNTLTDTRLAGRTIAAIITGGAALNTGFILVDDTLTFDFAEFVGGEVVTFILA